MDMSVVGGGDGVVGSSCMHAVGSKATWFARNGSAGLCVGEWPGLSGGMN